MKVEETYKEWCGVDKHTNDCHPVHDSTETIEFAESYAKEHAKQAFIAGADAIGTGVREIIERKADEYVSKI